MDEAGISAYPETVQITVARGQRSKGDGERGSFKASLLGTYKRHFVVQPHGKPYKESWLWTDITTGKIQVSPNILALQPAK